MNLGTPSVHWGVNLCIFPRLETNMPQLLTYLFLILAQILFSLHILHSSETSEFLWVLPHYDRPSPSPTEVIEDDGLGNASVPHVGRKICTSESRQQKPKLSRPVTANYSHIAVFPFRQRGHFRHKSFQQRRAGRLMVSLLCRGVP